MRSSIAREESGGCWFASNEMSSSVRTNDTDTPLDPHVVHLVGRPPTTRQPSPGAKTAQSHRKEIMRSGGVQVKNNISRLAVYVVANIGCKQALEYLAGRFCSSRSFIDKMYDQHRVRIPSPLGPLSDDRSPLRRRKQGLEERRQNEWRLREEGEPPSPGRRPRFGLQPRHCCEARRPRLFVLARQALLRSQTLPGDFRESRDSSQHDRRIADSARQRSPRNGVGPQEQSVSMCFGLYTRFSLGL